jgi:4-amino-4-deoxy-L-arabinose transferase-like glycosyltransferase
MSGTRTGQAWIAAGVVLILFFCFAPVLSRDGRTFQIDEADKISETHFLRLFLQRDFQSPEWFRYVIDRTNPPVGKYALGIAILLHGLPLPPEPSLAARAPDGAIPAVFPRDVNARYARYLVPARCGTLAASSLAAALLVWCAMRLRGPVTAAGALLFFTFHDITRAWGATAVFDPLLMLAVIAIVPPTWIVWRDGPNRRTWLGAAASGVVCGLAIGVRLNGGICLLFAIAAFLGAAIRHHSRTILYASLVLVLTAATLAIALNPFYWAPAPAAPGVPAALTRNEPMPVRIVHRIAYQVRDLETLMSLLREGHLVLDSPARRLQFFGVTIAGSLVGFVMWLFAALGVLLPVLRRRVTTELRFLLLWTLIIAGGTAVWLPVPFQRYLLVSVPPLALAGGIGIAELADACRSAYRSRANRTQSAVPS